MNKIGFATYTEEGQVVYDGTKRITILRDTIIRRADRWFCEAPNLWATVEPMVIPIDDLNDEKMKEIENRGELIFHNQIYELRGNMLIASSSPLYGICYFYDKEWHEVKTAPYTRIHYGSF